MNINICNIITLIFIKNVFFSQCCSNTVKIDDLDVFCSFSSGDSGENIWSPWCFLGNFPEMVNIISHP